MQILGQRVTPGVSDFSLRGPREALTALGRIIRVQGPGGQGGAAILRGVRMRSLLTIRPRPLHLLVKKDALVTAGRAAEARPEVVAPVAEEAVAPVATPVARGVWRRTTLWWPSYKC